MSELKTSLIVLIGGFFLWNMLGISALAGILLIPAMAPLTAWNARKIYGRSSPINAEAECDKVWARCRDARTSATKELITSIKPIKVSLV